MAFAQWLVPSISLEKQIDVERHARAVLTQGTEKEIRELCSQLVRTLAEKEQAISQAIGHILELEIKLEDFNI
nr:unnamed protein product [uncultured Mediterranean phage uvMED]